MKIEQYIANLHRHRLASWSSCRAASQSKEFKFSVKHGTQLLMLGATGEEIELDQPDEFIRHVEAIRLFCSQKKFDCWHNETIKNMKNGSGIESVIKQINRDKKRGKKKLLDIKNYSYGIAVKLLNSYLKVFYLGDLEPAEFAHFIHPPIDRVLLEQLQKCQPDDFDFCQLPFKPEHLSGPRQCLIPKWTVVDKEEYQAIIEMVKKFIADKNVQGLWRIEFAWRGYQ